MCINCGKEYKVHPTTIKNREKKGSPSLCKQCNIQYFADKQASIWQNKSQEEKDNIKKKHSETMSKYLDSKNIRVNKTETLYCLKCNKEFTLSRVAYLKRISNNRPLDRCTYCLQTRKIL